MYTKLQEPASATSFYLRPQVGAPIQMERRVNFRPPIERIPAILNIRNEPIPIREWHIPTSALELLLRDMGEGPPLVKEREWGYLRRKIAYLAGLTYRDYKRIIKSYLDRALEDIGKHMSPEAPIWH